MIKPFLTVLALYALLLTGTLVEPDFVTPVMLVSFFFGLLKAATVIAVARLVLAYLDKRLKFDVNRWLINEASNDNKALYFSIRFASVFIVFGFIMA